jgi:excisionase family DNA binding protein
VAATEDPSTTQNQFMTVSEVAATLRVSTMTVYRLINGGDLPAVRIGRSFRVRKSDFGAFVAGRLTAAG